MTFNPPLYRTTDVPAKDHLVTFMGDTTTVYRVLRLQNDTVATLENVDTNIRVIAHQRDRLWYGMDGRGMELGVMRVSGPLSRCDGCDQLYTDGESANSELFYHDESYLELCASCTEQYSAEFGLEQLVKVRKTGAYGRIVEVGKHFETDRPLYAISTGDGERFLPEELTILVSMPFRTRIDALRDILAPYAWIEDRHWQNMAVSMLTMLDIIDTDDTKTRFELAGIAVAEANRVLRQLKQDYYTSVRDDWLTIEHVDMGKNKIKRYLLREAFLSWIYESDLEPSDQTSAEEVISAFVMALPVGSNIQWTDGGVILSGPFITPYNADVPYLPVMIDAVAEDCQMCADECPGIPCASCGSNGSQWAMGEPMAQSEPKPPFDSSRCSCHTGMPPCGYCESDEYEGGVDA